MMHFQEHWEQRNENDKIFWEVIGDFYHDLRALGVMSEVELGLVGNRHPRFAERVSEIEGRLPSEWQYRINAFVAVCQRRRADYEKLWSGIDG